MDFDWQRGALAEGLACYRSGEFFLAHEHWESVWLRAPGAEKTFLQALIQTTVAFHHLQMSNTAGAASLMQRALRKLKPYPDAFGGIAVRALREDLERCLLDLEQGRTALPAMSPRIEPFCAPAEPGI
ncbi:MAG TPA: DUF309 domain-containing protein [Terracidiphilus sp.]|nr:DUF309 domain-containing protein [Terracidiphilus sp.]